MLPTFVRRKEGNIMIEFATRLGLAFILGASIGVERQWRQRSAGLRTNTLVSIGSASFILLSTSITNHEGDPSRVAAQIVSGVGFLGAGVIMKDGLSVRGLNTAATIWCSASVGCLSAIGRYKEAVLVTVTIMLTHLLLRPFSAFLNKFPISEMETQMRSYQLQLICFNEVENHIRVTLMKLMEKEDKILLKSLDSYDDTNPLKTVITAELVSSTAMDSYMESIAAQMTIEYQVTKVSWKLISTQSDFDH